MRYGSMAAFALFALTAIDGGNARAADAGLNFAKRLFAGQVGSEIESYACFARRYDAAHLAKHPRQKVGAMRLLVTAENAPEDHALNYSFRLSVKFRERKAHFESSGDCGHPMTSQVSADNLQLGCSVDCDGGGLSVELANADKSVLVRIDRIGIWNSANPDAEPENLEGGADDRIFRLDRVSLDHCRSLITDSDELAAMPHK